MKYGFALLLSTMCLAVCGCSSGSNSADNSTGSSATSPAVLPEVAFSQANSADPWRQVFDAETKSAAEKHASEFTFEEQAAEDDPAKQINQIQTLMLKSPKVLLVSPATEAVKDAIEKVYDSKVPVILLDRGIPGDKYTCLIGGDNVDIGRQAAEYIAKRLKGKGTVLMIQGLGAVTATTDRKNGAMTAFAKFPGIKVIEGDNCDYQRQKAQNFMETFLQKNTPFDAVYAHNDEMAIGAYMAWERKGLKTPRPLFVGVDGCQKEIVDMIQAGKIDATFKYPIPGPKGIEVAADLLKGKQPGSKKIVLPTEMITKDTAGKYLADNPSLAK